MLEKRDECHGQQRQHQRHQPGLAGRKPGAEQGELRHEDAERRQPDDGQHADRKEAARHRHGLEQPRHVFDLGRAVAVEHPARQQEEHGLGDGVIDQVQQAANAPSGPNASPIADQPGVLDAGVGQHAFVVAREHHAEAAIASESSPRISSRVSV